MKVYGAKVVYDIHENNPKKIVSNKKNILKRIESKLFKIFEQFAVYFFDGVVTARPDISQGFKWKKNLITVFNFPKYTPCDAIYPVKLISKKKKVIYIGGMSYARGITYLIQAFENIDNVELYLLGRFSSPQFKEQCQNTPGWENVIYLGVVEATEVLKYAKACDVGIITFLNYPNHITTVATKPFEYMAAGLPIIVSDFPYWRTFFKDSAIYVDPENPVKIKQAIIDLLEDENKLQKLRVKNLKLIQEQYNWGTVFKELKNLYDKILEKNNNGNKNN